MPGSIECKDHETEWKIQPHKIIIILYFIWYNSFHLDFSVWSYVAIISVLANIQLNAFINYRLQYKTLRTPFEWWNELKKNENRRKVHDETKNQFVQVKISVSPRSTFVCPVLNSILWKCFRHYTSQWCAISRHACCMYTELNASRLFKHHFHFEVVCNLNLEKWLCSANENMHKHSLYFS